MALGDGYSINSDPEEDCEETNLLLNNDMEPAVKEAAAPQLCSARYSLALLMFFGFAVGYGLRVNLSVAMVAMVNDTESHQSLNRSTGHECPAHSDNRNSSKNTDGPDGSPRYPWSPETQGMLLGASYFGKMVTPIPAGYLAGRFGGSIFLGGGVLGTAALTLLTPLAAQLGVSWLFALRALEGFGEGVTLPAMMTMWACWAPPLERSRLMTISGAGASFGAFVAFPVTGIICESLGWPAVFYICGGAGCLWAVFWFFLVSDEPRTHPRISEPEKNYIINSIGSQGSAHGWSIPLVSMMFSVPLWAIIICQMCSNWSYYTLLTSLPTYMGTVLHLDLQQNSFLSALPYLGAWLFSVLSGVVADHLLEREMMSVTAVRKIFTLVGLVLPAAFLVAVGYTRCSSALAVICLTLSTTIGGTSAAGVFINQIDIAPRYAGFLLGITNTFGTIPGVLSPIAVGYLAKDHSLSGWRNVFLLSAGVSVFGALFYLALGSGKIQRWAVEEELMSEEEKMER
ncbi:sialin-like [Denticeps clupeoides]|uniref:sialin-like n=1 Tax=Denticeps clupeoides TaxID=299321 RepID=UPI0010A3D576|nr:sialin-like [Denticeps clupeoides]